MLAPSTFYSPFLIWSLCGIWLDKWTHNSHENFVFSIPCSLNLVQDMIYNAYIILCLSSNWNFWRFYTTLPAFWKRTEIHCNLILSSYFHLAVAFCHNYLPPACKAKHQNHQVMAWVHLSSIDKVLERSSK